MVLPSTVLLPRDKITAGKPRLGMMDKPVPLSVTIELDTLTTALPVDTLNEDMPVLLPDAEELSTLTSMVLFALLSATMPVSPLLDATHRSRFR